MKLGDDRRGAASGWLRSDVTEWMRTLRREGTAAKSEKGAIGADVPNHDGAAPGAVDPTEEAARAKALALSPVHR